jgi:hypothetical protein
VIELAPAGANLVAAQAAERGIVDRVHNPDILTALVWCILIWFCFDFVLFGEILKKGGAWRH